MYYKRHELQLRVSVFFSASILAGAFSGVSTPPQPASILTELRLVAGIRNFENVRRRWLWRMALDIYH